MDGIIQEWTWSWVTICALVGAAINLVLPIHLARIEKNSTISIPTENPLAPNTANISLGMLIHVARGRRLWIFAGVPVQLSAFLLAGFITELPFSILVPILIEIAGIGFVVSMYAKWQHTFHPQSVRNVMMLVHERISNLTRGRQ